MRADSGFWSWKLVETLDRLNVRWSITDTKNSAIHSAIAAIPEAAWVNIDYTLGGKAQVAETNYTIGTGRRERRVRLVVRRNRFTDRQAQLSSDWRHHAFITNTGRWTAILGHTTTSDTLLNHKTMRTRLIAVAATLVNRSGQLTLRLPLNWPWADRFTQTLTALRALPAPSG